MSNHIPFLLQYGTPDHIDSAIKASAKKRDDDRTWDEKGALEDLADTGNKRHIDTMLDHHGINDNLRYHIASYGNDEHREKLLNHPDIKLGATLSTIMSGSRNGYDHIATDEHREKAKRLKS